MFLGHFSKGRDPGEVREVARPEQVESSGETRGFFLSAEEVTEGKLGGDAE